MVYNEETEIKFIDGGMKSIRLFEINQRDKFERNFMFH